MPRTIEDRIRAAGRETSSAGVEVVLREAMAHVERAYEWRWLIKGLDQLASVPEAIVPELANRALAAGVAEREISAVRDVAQLRLTRMGDLDGARQALDAGVQMLEAAPPQPPAIHLTRAPVRGYEWVLLADGFAETLVDRDRVRHCLERGRDLARAAADADDLVAIGAAWARHVDRDAGIALVAEAEQLGANGSVRPWTLANAWHALGDTDAMRRVLDAALARATTVAAALHVANAWSIHDAPDAARLAAARAESLATTAADWLAVAETALDARFGDDAIRRALAAAERALARGDDGADDVRARVSGAYQQWLGDAEAAARVGPRGFRPGVGRPRLHELPGHDASATALFDHLRARATPETLRDIAGADYGHDHAKHLAALSDIVATGCVPRVLAWEPREVLALTRWSEGEHIDHVARALSAALLCISPSDMDELVTNGPILLESCMALGAEAVALAAPFFAWYAEISEEPERSIALLLLVLAYAALTPADPRIVAVLAALDREALGAADLLGSLRSKLWRELVTTVLPSDPALVPVRELVLGAP